MKLKISSPHAALYLLAYSLFIFYRTFSISLLSNYNIFTQIFSIFRWVIVFLLVASFFVQRKFSLNMIIAMVVLALVSVALYLNSDSANFLCVALLIFTLICLNVHIDEVLKTSIFMNVLMLIIIFSSCLFGVVPDLTYSHSSLIFGFSQVAHSLGFVYYSNPQFIILFVTLMLLYFRHNVKTLILCLAINFVSYLIFTTNLPFLIFIIAIIFYALFVKTNFLKKCGKIALWIFMSVPVVFTILSVLISYFYNSSNGLMYAFDSLLRSRISLGHRALSQYGISLFGQRVIMQGTYTVTYGNYDSSIGNFYIDNDYLYMLIAYGIIFTIIILFVYMMMIRYSILYNNEWLFIWSITTLVFSLVNSSIIAIQFNPIIMIGMLLMNKNIRLQEGSNIGNNYLRSVKQ